MAIKIQNISKTFNCFKAVDNVSVEFPDGKLTALLGPSGSGKTTLLRLVAGLESPDNTNDSKILFNGKDVSKNDVGKRQVGFVFQHYALFRHMTVFENVAFGLTVMKKKDRPAKAEIKRRVMELLQLVQLDTMYNRMPSQLSGGQRQRVALARALAIQPKVLLLDEPFGALDAKVRNELRKWLRNLHETLHFTSIFVTHDQEEALEVADQVIVMNQGRIEQIGTPDDVFHQPANEFVMQFLGEVNVFSGRIDKNNSDQIHFTASSNTDTVNLMIRPHDFEIHQQEQTEKQQIPARITRIQTAGPIVKIDFCDESGKTIIVHVSHEDFRNMKIEDGQKMYLSPKQLYVQKEC